MPTNRCTHGPMYPPIRPDVLTYRYQRTYVPMDRCIHLFGPIFSPTDAHEPMYPWTDVSAYSARCSHLPIPTNRCTHGPMYPPIRPDVLTYRYQRTDVPMDRCIRLFGPMFSPTDAYELMCARTDASVHVPIHSRTDHCQG